MMFLETCDIWKLNSCYWKQDVADVCEVENDDVLSLDLAGSGSVNVLAI